MCGAPWTARACSLLAACQPAPATSAPAHSWRTCWSAGTPPRLPQHGSGAKAPALHRAKRSVVHMMQHVARVLRFKGCRCGAQTLRAVAEATAAC